MPDDEQLTPEEADVRNQAMLQDLRDMHSPIMKAQSLENVRNRLLAKQRTSTLNSIQNSKRFTHRRGQGRLESMSDMLISTAGKKGRYLNLLAAGVIAALLIGSLLFVVTRVHQNDTGGGGPTNSSPVSTPTPSPTCNPSKLTPTPAPGTMKPTVVPGATATPSPICDPIATPVPAGTKPTVVPAGTKPTVVPGGSKSTVVPGGAKPTATTVPTIAPGVQPTATPAPGVQPTATPAPGVQPTATPAPGVQLTATPAPS